MARTNSRVFMESNFPDLTQYKSTTSRKWESSEEPWYRDNWWFKFHLEEVEESEFVVFVGALDYTNTNFKVFRVPSDYILSNVQNLDSTAKGWMNLYIHLETYRDVRNKSGLPFGQFAVN